MREKLKKIILIYQHSYGLRDHHRFGMDYLMDCGYNVEIWRIIYSDSNKINYSSGMYFGSNYHEYSVVEYKKRIKQYKNTSLFLVVDMPKPISVLASARCKYIVLRGLGAIPSPADLQPCEYPNSVVDKVSRYMNSIVEDGLFKCLWRVISNVIIQKHRYYINARKKKIVKSFPPCLTVTSTHYAAELYMNRDELSGNVMYIHSMDYDRYIEINRKPKDGASSCILYCDTGLFHVSQDSIIYSNDFGYEYEREYYEQLEKLFCCLEKQFNLPVKIAGHPHVLYGKNAFCGREVIFDKTCELAKSAKVFILTDSTAVSFAVLYNVPILRIVNGRMKTIKYDGYDNSYSFIKYAAEEIMECGFLDLDDKEKMKHPWDCIKPMNPSKREVYIKKYLIDNYTTNRTIIEYVNDEFIRSMVAMK